MNICLFSGQGNEKKIIFNKYSDKYFDIVKNNFKISKNQLITGKYVFKNQILSLINNVSNFDKLKIENNDFFQNIDTLVGYSLGEYSALVCGGVISFNECIRLIKFRSELMNKIGKKTNSTLITILGINEKFLKTILGNIKYYIAIYLSENAHVLAVNNKDLSTIVKKVKLMKRFNKIGLKILHVDGGFHSPFMNDCINEFKKYLDQVNLKLPKYNIISNVDGNFYQDINKIKKNLLLHLTSPLNWKNILSSLNIKKIYELGGDSMKKTLELNKINTKNYNYIK